MFISECKFNGSLLKSGDDVIVGGKEDEYFVGHIEKLYELEGADDPNRAIVHWYFTYQELIKLTKNIKTTIHVDVPEPLRELFLPSGEDIKGSVEDIDAETISSKCTVLKLKPQDSPPDSLNCDTQEDLFYVRYKFDRRYKLHPVNKRIARELVSKKECDLLISGADAKIPKATPRRSSTRKRKPVQENDLHMTVKTPQTRKTPARRKSMLHD